MPTVFTLTRRVAWTAIATIVLISSLLERVRRAADLQAQLPTLVGQAVLTLDQHGLVSVVDDRGSILFASRSHQSLLGYNRETLIGRTAFELLHPEDVDQIAAKYRLALNAGTARLSFRLRCADGCYRWMEASALRRVDTSGQALLIVVSRDITERTALEAQLQQKHKLDSVGRLAGGIAHDFNNLLSGIAGMTELSLRMLAPDHPVYADLLAIRDSTTRAANLVDQLLAFVREQKREPRTFALDDLISEMRGFLQRLIGADITLVTNSSSELGLVRADRVQIQQVLLNLVVNARDAMPQDGQITIETANVTLETTSAHEGGNYVMVRVSDRGIGMPPEIQARIFDPFFTTKEPGKGTGLGLAICSEIIRQHGGSIQVYSAPGCGTRIEVYLPAICDV